MNLGISAGVVTHNVTSLRAEAAFDAEVVTQAVLGDPVTLLEETDSLVRVRMEDGYEGWVRRSHLRGCVENDPFRPGAQVARVTAAFCPAQSEVSDYRTLLVHGTRVVLPDAGAVTQAQADFRRKVLLANGETVWLDGRALGTPAAYPPQSVPAQSVLLAERYLGTPYFWGGTTPFGIDCSGLVQRVFQTFGILLPRDAYQQAASPLIARLPDDASLQAGDLVFFGSHHDPRQRGITHVGILADPTQVIHAYGPDGVIRTPLHSPLFTTHYLYRGAGRLKSGE